MLDRMDKGLVNVLFYVPVFLFSLCVHEYAHAWVATVRGDTTPGQLGRLSMHPLAHADMVGTLLLPIICIYNGWPFFGWAKPVPIDARNFKYGRLDMALVAAAGPAANIVLALISAAGLALLARIPLEGSLAETLPRFAAVSIQLNIILALFNLIPIPPLDGYNILRGVLPLRPANLLSRLAPHANLILFLLLFSGGFRILSGPASACYGWLVNAAIGPR